MSQARIDEVSSAIDAVFKGEPSNPKVNPKVNPQIDQQTKLLTFPSPFAICPSPLSNTHSVSKPVTHDP
jgi:hypothetical protein